MSEIKRKRETILPEKFRSDYILQGDAAKVLNKISRENSSCSKKDMIDTLTTLGTELEKLSIEAKKNDGEYLIKQLESMTFTDETDGTKKMRMNGGMTGMSASALIMYLIADAMREGAKYGYEQITKLLAGGLKVLEFLSNKDGCTELILREYLGKKIMLFIQFYYIGIMANKETIPINVIIKIAELLPKLLPYVMKGISAGFISFIGYLIYHFVNHYGTKLTKAATDKLNALKNALDALEQAKSETVVLAITQKTTEMVKKTTDLITELKHKPPVLTENEKKEFMDKIKRELVDKPEKHIGELDPYTKHNIRNKFKAAEKYRDLYDDVLQYSPPDSPEYSPFDGGKKHKKRKTHKRKNKSNKKTTKKSNKSKKHHK